MSFTPIRIRPGVTQFQFAIDWGWFRPITQPIFWLLDHLYRLIGNFGLAILALTVIVKTIFFPIANAQYKSMGKMKKVQPEMERIKERNKDDPQKQQQALMELYKREKVNPVAGCLPMLLIIPVFFSLYKVINVTIEARHAPFYGWIHDLAAPDPTSIINLFGLLPFDPHAILPSFLGFLSIGVWPILMGCTQWLQTKMNPAPADPVQAQMFAFMPLIFTFMFATFPAGLVIYYTWNNLLSVRAAICDDAQAGRGSASVQQSENRQIVWRQEGASGIERMSEAYADAEAARKLFAGPCDFIWGATSVDNLPPATLPEIAFVGPLQRGQVFAAQCADGAQNAGACVAYAGPHAADQFLQSWWQARSRRSSGYGYAKASKSPG